MIRHDFPQEWIVRNLLLKSLAKINARSGEGLSSSSEPSARFRDIAALTIITLTTCSSCHLIMEKIDYKGKMETLVRHNLLLCLLHFFFWKINRVCKSNLLFTMEQGLKENYYILPDWQLGINFVAVKNNTKNINK